MTSLPFAFYLITDRRLAPQGDLPGLLARILCDPAGQVAVQLREKDLGARELLSLAQEVRQVTRKAGALLLISDRIDIALAADADGVHLAGHSVQPEAARVLLGPDRLLGASTHSLPQARAARDGGCDFATFGPVFHTPSKAAYGNPVGLDQLTQASRDLHPFPLVALGGVTLENAAACRSAGAAAVSAIRAVLAAPDPAAACRTLSQT